jgi:ligand-binding SRPBCC domain-containing protein
MQLIQLETPIAAPPERCFLLSLNMDLHMQSTEQTNEVAIAGTTHGIIGPNETVTWRGRHFGFMLTHQSLISKYDRPIHFQDIMLQGMFKRFEHDHFFEPTADGTLMRDELRFTAPLGILGRIAETLILRRYLTHFLKQRNDLIKRVAEGPQEIWSMYVDATPSASNTSCPS